MTAGFIQQGDTLYFREPVPEDAAFVAGFDGVVQHGESTGHAHRLHGDGFHLYTKDKSRYLRIVTPTALRHEEHREITLDPGDYRIDIVREYDYEEEEMRRVVD